LPDFSCPGVEVVEEGILYKILDFSTLSVPWKHFVKGNLKKKTKTKKYK
jgi:hypothetical protein